MSLSISVDVHGSCVSRSIFNVEKDCVKVNHNFSRNNIVSCMMPPVNILVNQAELQYSSDYAYRCVQYALNKQTLPLLLQSDSDFLIIDFYDFCQHVAAYENTTFSTYDYTVLNIPSLKPYISKIKQLNFFEISKYLWYGYVDLYFERVKERFGDNIVIVRLSCCDKYLSKSKKVLPTPARMLFFGNSKYNADLQELEDYVIKKYNPYVIDVSKYFIADEEYNADVTPVHFEEKFQISAWKIMKHILINRPVQRYYDYISSNTVSYILNRPVSTDDFVKIYKGSAKPFSSCEFLDEVCMTFSEDDIFANRKWLGKLYGVYDSTEIDIIPQSEVKKINIFMEKLPKDTAANDFSKIFIERLLQKQCLLQMNPDQLYEHFINAFENDDLIWTSILSCLRILAPKSKDVLFYSKQYYLAVNNIFGALKCEEKLLLFTNPK